MTIMAAKPLANAIEPATDLIAQEAFTRFDKM
jgi:hypothetical protein